MGYGESLVSGVNAGIAMNRDRRAEESSSGGGVYTQAPSAPARQSSGMAMTPARQAVADPLEKSRAQTAQSYLAAAEAERKSKLTEGIDEQAADYDFAVQAMQIGNMAGIEDYLERYGSDNVKAKIQRDPSGKIVVTPQVKKGEGWAEYSGNESTRVTADADPDPNPVPPPMVFNNAREFYTNFFGTLKPEKSRVALPEKAKKTYKPLEIGAKNGMMTQALYDDDGNVMPVGEAYPGSKNGHGGGGDLPAEAKLINFYMQNLGMTQEKALSEIRKAKASPQKYAADLYTSLLKMESGRLIDADAGEVRRTPDELKAQAMADTKAFFGQDYSGEAGAETETTGGMKKTAPPIVLNIGGSAPAYNGPLRPQGMAPGAKQRPSAKQDIEEAEIVSAPAAGIPSGAKPAINPKTGKPGTRGGKPVYQLPDGRLWVAE